MKLILLLTVWLQVVQPAPTITIKQQAFMILQTKCNVCHTTQNPAMVFTLENMDQHAKKIKWQVFLFKRMPKGNTVHLTDDERAILKKWIEAR